MNEYQLPQTICSKCGSLLTFRPDTGDFYCEKCKVLTESFSSSEVFSPSPTSGATIETRIFQQRTVVPEIGRPTYEEFKELKKDVEAIKSRLPSVAPKVVVIGEISKEQAMEKVEDYFKEHGRADIEELMLNLRIDVRTLVEIIDELREKGKIEAEDEPES